MKTIQLIIIGLFVSIAHIGLAQNENFVKTRTANEPIMGSLAPDENIPDRVKVDIQYVDGLGRSEQSIQRQASPTNHGRLDIVGFVEYDANGRVVKDYLPYMSSSMTGFKVNNPSAAQDNFYDQLRGGGEGTNAFQQSVYEQSPLNRVINSYGPGNAWAQASGNKPINQHYRANNTSDQIDRFYVTYDPDHRAERFGFYPIGTLWVSTTTDENGNEMIEFTDKFGRVVAKKAQVETTVYTTTYYIYDDLGNLTFVIPPEAKERASANWDLLNNDTFREDWMFCYKYDQRRRMIEKQVPGAKPTYMVYDTRDRLILTQTGRERKRELIETIFQVLGWTGSSYGVLPGGRVTLGPGFSFSGTATNRFTASARPTNSINEWIFSKYDDQNRPIATGLYKDDRTRSEIQAEVAAQVAISESYLGTTGPLEGYSNNAYPSADITEERLYSISYYDDYKFTSDNHWSLDDYSARERETGLMTGQKTRILGGELLEEVSFYDERDRVEEIIMQNHKGGTDIITTTYDNLVRPLVTSTSREHTSPGVTRTMTEEYTYDHRDRLLSTKVVTGSEEANYVNEYNQIGELVKKDLNSAQEVDYEYNIRGWLTDINGGTSFDDPADVFGMQLSYTDAPSANRQYNGNIGQMSWKTTGGMSVTEDTQTYSYTYDRLDRLKQAQYTTTGGNGHYDVGGNANGIGYDLNGNILSLNRKMAGADADLLTYTYTRGNQLSRVSDDGSNEGFDEELSEGSSLTEYFYDFSGNMITDRNKGITQVYYNYLNLPERVNLENGNYTIYTYTARGEKLRKEVYQGNAVNTTDYVKGLHYKDETVDFVQNEEGRYSYDRGEYEYDLKDHLGNVRSTVSYTLSGEENFSPIRITSYFFDGADDPGFNSQNGTLTTTRAFSGQTSLLILNNSDEDSYPIRSGENVNVKVLAYNLAGSAGRLVVSFIAEGSGTSQTLQTVPITGETFWQRLQTDNIAAPGDGQIVVRLESTSAGAPSFFDDLVVSIYTDIEGQYYDPNVYTLEEQTEQFVLFQNPEVNSYFQLTFEARKVSLGANGYYAIRQGNFLLSDEFITNSTQWETITLERILTDTDDITMLIEEQMGEEAEFRNIQATLATLDNQTSYYYDMETDIMGDGSLEPILDITGRRFSNPDDGVDSNNMTPSVLGLSNEELREIVIPISGPTLIDAMVQGYYPEDCYTSFEVIFQGTGDPIEEEALGPDCSCENLWIDFEVRDFLAPETGVLTVVMNDIDECETPVYFDELYITTRSVSETNELEPVLEVVQRDDYYPYGMTFNSYTSGTQNNYKYNQGLGSRTFQGLEGKTYKVERQVELGVDFTKYRAYDPALGRWWQVDPAADQVGQESWTPYHYSLNNPIRWNDPFGDCINGDCPKLTVSGPSANTEVKNQSSKATAQVATVNIQATEGNTQAEIGVAVVQGKAEAKGSINKKGVVGEASVGARGIGFEAGVTKGDGQNNVGVGLAAELGVANAGVNVQANKDGVAIGGEAGAYLGKAEGKASFTVGGFKVELTAEVTGVSLHAGAQAGATRNDDGTKTVGAKAHVGAGAGGGLGFSITWE